MPLVYFSSNRMENVPEQAVYLGSTLDPGMVCTQVITDLRGSTAYFVLPRLAFDSNKVSYYTGKVTVYARTDGTGWGAPIFVGYIDQAQSNLRDERVEMIARSPLAYLRDRPINVKTAYNLTSAAATFSLGTTHHLPSINPYKVRDHEVQVRQMSGLMAYLYGTLDSFWQGITTFWVDGLVPAITAESVSVSRFQFNTTTAKPEFATTTREVSPLSDIIFRSSSTAGQILDYLVQLTPGLQVFELFTAAETSQIWIAYPQSMGSVVATAGRGNVDWRDVGGDVTELSVSVENSQLVNRVVGFGAPASCVVTVLSEMQDGAGMHVGLLPDWPLYVTGGATFGTAEPVPGIGTFDYSANTYNVSSVMPQRLSDVLLNPAVAIPGEPEYKPGYERVGRCWRLPNWFAYAEIERKGDLFIDPRTGAGIAIQVFAEVAVPVSQNPVPPTLPQYKDNYGYKWVQCFDFQFDPETRTLTFPKPIVTFYIATIGGIPLQPAKWTTAGLAHATTAGARYKLARIAITFTYSHQNWTLCSDTYLDNSSVISSSQATAILSGQPFVFERLDLRYTQATNANLELVQKYKEIFPTTSTDAFAKGNYIYQEPMDTETLVTYPDFIVAAHADVTTAGTAENLEDEKTTKVLAYVPVATNQYEPLGRLSAPVVLRNDIAKLRKVVQQVYGVKSKRPRKFQVAMNQLAKGVFRGMQLGFQNLANLSTRSDDSVDSVTHDLVRGETIIQTTNTPSDNTVASIIKG